MSDGVGSDDLYSPLLFQTLCDIEIVVIYPCPVSERKGAGGKLFLKGSRKGKILFAFSVIVLRACEDKDHTVALSCFKRPS